MSFPHKMHCSVFSAVFSEVSEDIVYPPPEKLPYFVKFHIVASVKQLIGVILGLCCLGAEGEGQI